MAIFHLHIQYIQRAEGRNAVAAAAYRSGTKLYFERGKVTFDYSKRRGVAQAEIVVPDKSNAGEWAFDRQKLWNKAENIENRKDARTAWEIECALPYELDGAQRYDLALEYAKQLANETGAAVDFAIHFPIEEKGEHPKNHHVHYLLTTRKVEKDGLGEKVSYLRSEAWRRKNGHPNLSQQTLHIRKSWEVVTNFHLAKAGLDVRIDHRSHADRGFEMKPTQHVGAHATAMQRKGADVQRQRLHDRDRNFNTVLAQHQPGEIFRIITAEKSVFNRTDIARTIHRYTNLEGQEFQNLFHRIMQAPELVELRRDSLDSTGQKVPAQYSTKEVVGMEVRLMQNAEALHTQSHRMSQKYVDRAIARLNKRLHDSTGANVSQEQRESVEYLTGPHRLSIMVGHAGTGKSTVLGMANEAWQAQGYRVIGTALSGKAADGLEQSSGIKSQTLASLERDLKYGRKLNKNDVLVVDEAGMLDNGQLARVVAEVEKSGAKLALVGDPEQLQAIGAGGGFRSLAETIGSYRLSEIRRQKIDWQAKASADFATQKTSRALRSYDLRRLIKFDRDKFATIRSVVGDYVSDFEKSPDATRLAISHRKKDVRMLNAAIRAKLQADGHLSIRDARVYQTIDGLQSFVQGDRVAMLANDKKLGLKNGMLATVKKVGKNSMTVHLDDSSRKVVIPMNDYRAVTHGYASTIHKSQGTTVDSTYVLASASMDRHMTYVAMSRHRTAAKMYASRNEISDFENLIDTLSRGNEKKSTLDFRQEFAERRGMETDANTDVGSKSHSNNWQNRQSDSSPVDAALDYVGMAMEERLWLSFHGVPRDQRPEEKFNHGLKMLDKAKPGLSSILTETIKHNRDQLPKIFVFPGSSHDRVKVLKQAMNEQIRRQREMDMRPTEPEPEPPSFGM